MDPRTLEARLSVRLLALAIAVLATVGAAAAVVTDRALAAGDEARARDEAAGARDALGVELSEGDSREEATREVIASCQREGIRVAVTFPDGERYTSGAPELPRLSAGACATFDDPGGAPWRVCGTGDSSVSVVAGLSIAGHRAAVGAVWRAMVALVAVAALLLWWAIRRALRAPLAELTSLVRWSGMARGHDSLPEHQPPPEARTTEIAHLGAAFDVLVRDQLEALARERANSAHIAHELRTPLTAIVGELDALVTSDPAVRQAASRLRADATRLADVVDAILVLSDRARCGRREVVNVADLAREVAPAGVAVDAPDEALVEADERLVRLAVRNLLDNADKHGRGACTLRVSRDATDARIAVVDRGMGLDADGRARMFDRYWRQSADGQGRGLGLALVKAVAERHDGKVGAQPGPDGAGLEVSLTLGRVVGWHEPGVSR